MLRKLTKLTHLRIYKITSWMHDFLDLCCRANKHILHSQQQSSVLMQNSEPPQFCHYNCIFAYIGYLTKI